MNIEIEGLSARSTLRRIITRKITAVLDGPTLRPIAVRIGFVDENGPKGGVGTRCGINIDLPRRASIHVEQRAESERLAFDGALEALARRLERERGRTRAVRRRPKKYYLAKRLLMPDETLDALEKEPEPVRRSALRKTA